MPAVLQRVELLAHTPDPLSLVYAAFRQCYHAGFVADMWPRLLNGSIDPETQADFVRNIMESGHTSPIEHVSFTFAVTGISRALSHQLVRHRIASYSQQSQRYVDASHFEYVLPPSLASNPKAKELFESYMQHTATTYQQLKQLLEEDGKAGSRANEDARFVLPQAASTALVVTMNCRSLLNFFEHRTCTRAQWEIRHMAGSMLKICKEILPAVFAKAGARCESLGYCPEGEKFCCGRYPVKA